jgi:hypothetical protein
MRCRTGVDVPTDTVPSSPSSPSPSFAAAIEPAEQPSPPRVAVVVPAHQDHAAYRRCLAALAACVPPPDEVVVVVDGADEATRQRAIATGATVVALPQSGGPARARNRGAAATTSELLFFVDSDVAVPGDIIARVRRAFRGRDDLHAIIGSYDTRPPAPGIVSQYKNLLNHHIHQTTSTGASTFWGACGIVRRSAFDAVGGFDERYTRPCVEDIELGYRLRDAGCRIEVAKDVQVTHLKRWTLTGMVRADIFDRAVPWTELILDGAGFDEELNISSAQRRKVAIACATAAAITLAPRARFARIGAVTGLLTLTWLDRDLLGLLRRERGVGLSVAGAGLHWSSYLYSAATFVAVAARRAGSRGRDGQHGRDRHPPSRLRDTAAGRS